MKKNLLVFALAALLSGGLVFAWLLVFGFDEQHLRQMLRASAWVAILVYLLVFVARPLRQLNPSAFNKSLLRNRRYVGIALAAVMTVHLVLLLVVNRGEAFKLPGALVYLLLYLMLFTSFNAAPAAMGPRNWRLLHKIGLYALGAGFLSSIGGAFLVTPFDPVYLLLMLLMLGAIVTRLLAFRKVRHKTAAIDSAR